MKEDCYVNNSQTMTPHSTVRSSVFSWKNRVFIWDFLCSHVPDGNGLAEQCRSIKSVADRKKYSIPKTTYWYKVTPNVNVIYTYEVWHKEIDSMPPMKRQATNTQYKGRDRVCVKSNPYNQCTFTRTFNTERITRIVSGRVPLHI